ncbi:MULTISPECIES: cation transporter [Sphingomonadales]|jgi:cation diffusion facilitator family transporter|uniref:Cation transporter n=1 Tax=Sphingopyxis granuli TaxID=267128 RepID=A0AA86GQA1_9SPHN|nr:MULTISPECIES: cation transporter [Sphingomonadales]AMG75182.1 Cation transporter [Sphingopyxis granuli]KPL67292.1 cation transporter [Erythrobacter sp. SG61-1L]MBL0002448.1 cation transporter [Sphingomonadales bacterium]
MADDCCSKKSEAIAEMATKRDQRRVLIIVMAINFAMFIVEFSGGVVAQSSALMADSIDMFGDGVVYALSLYALHRGAQWEAGAAIVKGIIIFVFGAAVLWEIADKIVNGVPPSSSLMLLFGGTALAANVVCLALLWRFRNRNVNMSSTFECSRNDVVSNFGVIVAAGLVHMSGSVWPDIVVGGLIAFIFLRSSWRVLRDAVPAWREASLG